MIAMLAEKCTTVEWFSSGPNRTWYLQSRSSKQVVWEQRLLRDQKKVFVWKLESINSRPWKILRRENT